MSDDDDHDEDGRREVYLERQADDTFVPVSNHPNVGLVVGYVPENPDIQAIARKLETIDVVSNIPSDVLFVKWRDVDQAKAGDTIKGEPSKEI